jgi:ribosomal peptide maturation radical SAM protein 1
VDPLNVSFVVMPFCNVHMPALGVSLLKAGLTRIGISAQIHYFNLKFAERIGLELYDRIAETEFPSSLLIGELIFARSVFGGSLPDNRRHIRHVLRNTPESKNDPSYVDRIEKEIRVVEELIPMFIQECVHEVLSKRPTLLGFTSTFHQNCAALLLASAIKSITNVPVIFGGANCEGEMGWELLNSVNCVDFVCSGEGDIAFIEFMKSLLRSESNQKINGIISRESNAFDASITNPVMNMDDLPLPDFDDYFIAVGESSFRRKLVRTLVMETSRGCWWGEKFQCTFCGLNGSTMKYRSKTVSRAIDELKYLKKRYKIRKFHLVDNILDLKYTNSLFPEILRQGLDIDLFYETKSNITKNQLNAMKQCGMREIQPGIESLSDTVLNIMKKGVSALQNIQVLKWCTELDITPYWNFLWGFPSEPEEEYFRMAEIIPLLMHLPPPQYFGKILLDRFSPYYFEPLKYGLVDVRPSISYSFVYPFPKENLKRIAYHFDFEYSDNRDVRSYTETLAREITEWKGLWTQSKIPALNTVSVENLTMINDTRPASIETFCMLKDEESIIYQLCQTPRTVENIIMNIKEEFQGVSHEVTTNTLCGLVYRKLLLEYNGRYLSLAIPLAK